MKPIKTVSWIFLVVSSLFWTSLSFPLENGSGKGSKDSEGSGIFVKVIDTGEGLSTVTRMPGGFYMVYDAGHWKGKKETMEGLGAVIPKGEEIDLLVLSTGGVEHIAGVPLILKKYRVRTILRTGLERQTKTWAKVDQVIKDAEKSQGTRVINLKEHALPYGATLLFRETLVTFVTGFYAPIDLWGIKDKTSQEFRNAGAIVMRLTFRGKSILFSGDAVGRYSGDPPGTLMATELFMVDNSDAIKIDSDILIAPGHGGDDASSEAFIKAVNPEYVIFSAGHSHSYPRSVTVKRYLDHGVHRDKIFRTDLHDDEGPGEWDHGKIPETIDPKGDDDINIRIRKTGEIVVEYAN